MAKKVIITADSTCDLPKELIDRFDIKTIPLTILLGEDSYLDGRDFTTADIYARYHADGMLPKTSAPSIQQFMDFFGPYIEEGCEIVHFDISAELSSTFNTSCIVAEELGGVYSIDTRSLSVGVGLLVIEAAECRDRGMSAAEIAEHVSSMIEKVDTSFILDTLEFMWKGGRCSGITALGANLLKLKPALHMKDGKLEVYKKYRGNINNEYRHYIKERLAGKSVRPNHVFIVDSGEIDEQVVADLAPFVRELINVDELHFAKAGCTISSHCGPKTLGIIFINE